MAEGRSSPQEASGPGCAWKVKVLVLVLSGVATRRPLLAGRAAEIWRQRQRDDGRKGLGRIRGSPMRPMIGFSWLGHLWFAAARQRAAVNGAVMDNHSAEPSCVSARHFRHESCDSKGFATESRARR